MKKIIISDWKDQEGLIRDLSRITCRKKVYVYHVDGELIPSDDIAVIVSDKLMNKKQRYKYIREELDLEWVEND